jgi:hypothetical protein
VTTRIAEYKGLIVAYRAPVLDSGRAPIHFADVIRMRESNLRLEYKSGRSATADVSGLKSGVRAGGANTVGDHSGERRAGNIQAATSTSVESLEPEISKRVKFDLRASREWELSLGEEAGGETKHRSEPRDAYKCTDSSMPNRVVTRHTVPSAGADTGSISKTLLPPKQIPEGPADVHSKKTSARSGDSDIFVSYKWG